jgi:acyl-CoA thioester hydrolase
MPRVKLTLPEHFSFTTELSIRITDLNYGGHVGNDSVLSLIHELRVQFLRHHDYQELDVAGVGLIMADVTIEFKAELFHGEKLRGSVAVAEFSRVGFDLYYKLEKLSGERNVRQMRDAENSASDAKPLMSVLTDEPSPSAQKWISVTFARTGMVCYDYKAKKIAPVPKEVVNKLLS